MTNTFPYLALFTALMLVGGQFALHQRVFAGDLDVASSVDYENEFIFTNETTSRQQIGNQNRYEMKNNDNSRVNDQFIVVLKANNATHSSEIASLAKSKGAEILHVYEHAIQGFSMKIPNEKVLSKIQQMDGVDYIEQDQLVQITAQSIPSGIDRIDADRSASAISGDGAGSTSVDIAVIDTGIDLRHPDLNVYKQKSFISGIKTANDDNGHGTHVAGIAAAKDNDIGTVGVAPGARLWAIKVLYPSGFGYISTIVKGIDYVTRYADEIEVANLSLGCECQSSTLDSAISKSVSAGVTFVVAAGNSKKDSATFSPANHPSVITVSAIVDSDGKCGSVGPSTSYGADDSFASFSNYGAAIDLASPGVNILSTYKGGGYATMSGTSMASPHVAGAAALYLSGHSDSTPAQVKDHLRSIGSKSGDTCDGKGRGYFTNDPDSVKEPLLYAATL